MNLSNAIAFAAQVFQNKYDKGGQPYILHCLRIMNKMDTDEERIVAILHDVVEDIFDNDFERGFSELIKAGYSNIVVSALRLLTHDKNQPYMDYIKALAHDPLARKIKMADLEDNSQITRIKGLTKKDFDRIEKYHTAYTYLSKI